MPAQLRVPLAPAHAVYQPGMADDERKYTGYRGSATARGGYRVSALIIEFLTKIDIN